MVGGVKELAILATVIALALVYDRVRVSAIFFFSFRKPHVCFSIIQCYRAPLLFSIYLVGGLSALAILAIPDGEVGAKVVAYIIAQVLSGQEQASLFPPGAGNETVSSRKRSRRDETISISSRLVS